MASHSDGSSESPYDSKQGGSGGPHESDVRTQAGSTTHGSRRPASPSSLDVLLAPRWIFSQEVPLTPSSAVLPITDAYPKVTADLDTRIWLELHRLSPRYPEDHRGLRARIFTDQHIGPRIQQALPSHLYLHTPLGRRTPMEVGQRFQFGEVLSERLPRP